MTTSSADFLRRVSLFWGDMVGWFSVVVDEEKRVLGGSSFVASVRYIRCL